MAFCLIKSETAKFKQALISGKINPGKLADMTSEQRNEYFQKFTSEFNATKINSLFESKLLLKHQQRGFITWAKSLTGITPSTKRDILSKINRMEKVLSTAETDSFMRDLASTRFGLGVTQAEAQAISDLAKQANEARDKANEDGEFKSEEQRLDYGMKAVALENFVNDMKLDANKINFKEQPLKALSKAFGEIPGTMKSLVASLDNSFFGRQGIKTLLDIRTSKIWVKAFLKSFKDIGIELKGGEAIDLIKADIYSRPNALNEKYRVGGYGLNVLNEEAFPSSFPEKIPLFGRLFKASESAYSGGALRMRADLADRMIEIGERNGLNMLNKEEAIGMGHLVSSMTGRGSLGKLEGASKQLNVLLFSAKFLKSNIDTLTAGLTDPKIRQNKVAFREAQKNLLSMVSSIASVLMLAKFFDDDSVDLEPRSTNFGKIKIFGKWTDITGGMAGVVRLASYLVPKYHDGRWSLWKKSSTGTWRDLRGDGFAQQDAWDILTTSLIDNKLSPVAQLFKNGITGEFFGGEKFTAKEAVKKFTIPLSIQSYQDLKNDPTAHFVLGSMIFESLGFSVSTYAEPNKKTGIIPTNKVIENEDFASMVQVYARAFGTDPETAFNRVFSGQKIMQVSDGGIIVVDRQEIKDSEAFKKKWVKEHGGKKSDIKEVRLDHTIPNKLGGEEKPGNWEVVPKSVWSSYTKTENAMIKAVKNKKLPLKEAQKLIVEFKKIDDTAKRKKFGEDLQQKYK